MAVRRGSTALLLLADARFPSGGHAHSGGMEEAIDLGIVSDLASLTDWASDVLWTVGLTGAGLAAASGVLAGMRSGAPGPAWDALDREADARAPSPAQRATSRRLGRQLLRTACRVWESELLLELARRWANGPHRPVAYGAATAVSGGTPVDAALGEAYGSVAVPIGAAVRLLALDPVCGASILAQLAPAMEQVAGQAVSAAAGEPASLPASSAPMVDLCAQLHANRKGVLFAS